MPFLTDRSRAVPRRRSTPTVIQMEAVECGAAALGMILGHHGRIVPLAELRRECGVSRDGSRASNVVKAARRYGLNAKGFSKSVESLRDVELPYIIFWHFNHFVVVEGFGKDKVFLNDPAVGHRTVTLEEFDEGFTGVTLVMSPGPDFEKGGRRPRMLPALRERLHGNHAAVWYCVLAGFLLVIPGLAVPAFMQVFLDNVLAEGRSEWLRPLVVAMCGTVLMQGSLRFLQLRYLRRLKLALSVRMSAKFFWHLLRLPAEFYSQRYAGEITSRTELNDKVADVLSGQLASTVIDVVMLVFYAAMMFLYDGVLTLIGIAFALLNVLLLKVLSSRRVEANMRLLQEYGKVGGAAIAGLQSMETIKSSGQESGFFAKLNGYYANASNARQEIETANQALGVVPSLLTGLATLLILVVGGYRVIDGALTIGMLVAFQSLMFSFLGPVNSLVGLGSTIQELHGDMARLDDVLAHSVDPSAPGEPQESAAPAALTDRVRLRGAIELRGVTFGYSPLDPPLIEDFGFVLKPGQRVALVGGSGSGKSTIAKIICGLFSPWSGEILLDGTRREDVPRDLVHNSLALVDQDISLFGGSVRDNLTLWDATVPEETLVRACRDADIHDVVRSLPGGLDSELGEGGNTLSGGQRQRLEIARALVGDPTILVLDEATSALDAETERNISDRLRLRGCSCIVVAHRLSTIRDCDEIIVLDRGKVVERGTHDELWRRGGTYAALLRTADGAGEAP